MFNPVGLSAKTIAFAHTYGTIFIKDYPAAVSEYNRWMGGNLIDKIKSLEAEDD